MAISSTSYTKTPQAGDDFYSSSEDYFDSNDILILDVMSNDLGGKAKTLFSVDDGAALSDLLSKDTSSYTDPNAGWELTSDKNLIRINNGKIEFKLSDNFNVNTLSEGETKTDTFKYAIQLGNGTISYATVTVTLTGTNDAPTLTATTAGSIAEIGQSSNTTDSGLSGTLVGHDVDNGAVLTYGVSGGTDNGNGTVSLAGDYGTLTVNTTSGVYTYVKNAGAIEALDATETDSDVFTMTVSDGIAPVVTQTYIVNVAGADDAPTLAAITAGSIAEVDQSSNTTDIGLSGTLAGADVDVETLSYGVSGGTDNGNGTFSLAGDYGTLTVNTTSGAYNYVKNAGAIEALDASETDSDVFTMTVSDGDGPAVTRTYTVNVAGANEPATVLSYIVPTQSATTNTITGSNSGSSGDDITGTLANDLINGRNGDDILNGGSGNDVINGGNGTDGLTGGLGFDYLNGGTQDDIFYYTNVNEATDVITDFTVNKDKLNFSGAITSGGAYYSTILVDTNNDNSADATLVRVDSNGAAVGGTLTDMVVLVGVTTLTSADVVWTV